MNNCASETDIEKLSFARDVLQEQIDARVAARDAKMLETDPFCKARKTRLLAKYVGALGFRILDYKGKEKPSPEASAVRAAGLEIWREYFKRLPSFDYSIRERFKLNRADVGWYQIRQSLKAYGESSEGRPIDFSAFDSAYAALTAKLRPQVFEYGFLKT